MHSSNPVKKTKSKTSIVQKFVDKFKKKKRGKSPSTSTASREKSAERSKGKRVSRSNSKSKLSAQSSKNELAEVTAKAYKKETKEKKQTKKKESAERSASNEQSSKVVTLTKSPSLIGLRSAESQMDAFIQKEKVERGTKCWMEQLEKIDLKSTLDKEFQQVERMKVEANKCTAFEKNSDLCQSDNTELLDANRVKNGDAADFFYHGSIITIPNIPMKVIIAQLPLRENPQSLEAFWLMVAANKIQRLYVLFGADEMDKKEQSEYFPEDFVEHTTIRVNSRKVLLRSDDQINDQLFYEVVPKDCAEAPFAMIEICDFWHDAKIPTQTARAAATAASVFESEIDPDATSGVVSKFGAGRAGSFVVSAAAIEKLRAGEAPNIKDIMVAVRGQRPGAVETFPQYIFAYVIALTYSLKHVTNPLKAKIEKMIGVLEQFAFEKQTEEDEEDSATTAED
ncbi:unnamed protein product [Caenorhabditis sp. 36 PRJEB53466]|nr:unnamed protein product [Caenorhabditis sp. 36 PRJEB53466]